MPVDANPAHTYLFIDAPAKYHGVKVTPTKKDIQALTLRIPVEDYNLLRAEAFVRDLSINEVVLAAIRASLDTDRRYRLQHMLEQARAAQAERGRLDKLPRNPQRRGINKRRKP